ncbi:MAG: hypothetical protein U1F43_35035 [Myxococcota bacterium]
MQTSLHSKLSLTLWRFDARTARFECLAAIPADESKPNYRFGTPSSAGAAHLDIVARRKDRALFLPRLAMSTRARDLVMDNVLGLDPRKPVFVLPLMCPRPLWVTAYVGVAEPEVLPWQDGRVDARALEAILERCKRRRTRRRRWSRRSCRCRLRALRRRRRASKSCPPTSCGRSRRSAW